VKLTQTITLNDHERHSIEAMRSSIRDQCRHQEAPNAWLVAMGMRRHPFTWETLPVQQVDIFNVTSWRFPGLVDPMVVHTIDERLKIIATAADAYCLVQCAPIKTLSPERVSGPIPTSKQGVVQMIEEIVSAAQTKDLYDAIAMRTETFEGIDLSLLYYSRDQGEYVYERPWLDLGRVPKGAVKPTLCKVLADAQREELQGALMYSWTELYPFVLAAGDGK
jgi:hypothetical protein